MTAVNIASGVFATLFGTLFLLYIYAHASMVNPNLTPDERRAQIVEKLFFQPGTYVGIGLVVAGVWLTASGLRAWGRRGVR